MSFYRPGCWDFDPDDDFLVADGLEVVTLLTRQADDTFTQAGQCRAARETPRRKPGAGLIEAVDQVWHLHALDIAGAERIGRGDVIRDAAGVDWVIGTSDLAGVQDQWRCETTRAATGMIAEP